MVEAKRELSKAPHGVRLPLLYFVLHCDVLAGRDVMREPLEIRGDLW